MNYHLSCSIKIDVELSDPEFDLIVHSILSSQYKSEMEQGGFLYGLKNFRKQSGVFETKFTIHQLDQVLHALELPFIDPKANDQRAKLFDGLNTVQQGAIEMQREFNSQLEH